MVNIYKYELTSYLRQWSTHIFALLFFCLGFLLMTASSGGIEGFLVQIGGSSKVWVNAPASLIMLISIPSYFAIFVIAAFMGGAVARDYQVDFAQLIQTTPTTVSQYLAGRFLAALTALIYILSFIGVGIFLATLMPFLNASFVGPNQLMAYLDAYIYILIPNTLFVGAIFFSIGALVKKTLPVYIASIILLIGYLAAHFIGDNLGNSLTASLADPFGGAAIKQVTKYWSVAAQNSARVPLEAGLLWNRLLWLGVGALFLLVTQLSFKPLEAVSSKKRRASVFLDSHPTLTTLRSRGEHLTSGVIGGGLGWQAFTQILRRELGETLVSRYFVVLLVTGVLFMLMMSSRLGFLYGLTVYPVTGEILSVVGDSFVVFISLILTIYAGDMVWRDRDAKFNEIFDALPVSEGLALTARLVALYVIIGILLFTIMLTGIVIQAASGFYEFEIGHYLLDLYGYQFLQYALIGTFAMIVHILVNQKNIGHFIMASFFIWSLNAEIFGVFSYLFRPFQLPAAVWSDMNGFGEYTIPHFWFAGYWSAAAGFLLIAGMLFWQRGTSSNGFSARFRMARQRAKATHMRLAVLFGGLFIALGLFINHNINVINRLVTTQSENEKAVDYEISYWEDYHSMEQPLLRELTLSIDLFPSRGVIDAQGIYVYENASPQNIDTLFINYHEALQLTSLAFKSGRAFDILTKDLVQNITIIKLHEGLAPTETLTLEISLAYQLKGFSNTTRFTNLASNGSYIDASWFPYLGYDPDRELDNSRTRKQYRLREVSRADRLVRSPASLVELDITVSSEKGQTVLAPGKLIDEGQIGERPFRHFRTSKTSPAGAWAVLSAKYDQRSVKWNGIDVEAFFHPGHPYNIDRMLEAAQKSLSYYSEQFGPYQYDYLRIAEVPGYSSGAQAYPGLIAFSETAGMIAQLPDNDGIVDMPFFITAHEIAHEWWGYQLVGARKAGQKLLIETLAQYSAMMVLEQEYGAEMLKNFRAFELDRYLLGRSAEAEGEQPLTHNQNQQYLHYNKGALAMYALKVRVGEAQINEALKKLLGRSVSNGTTTTVAADLIAELRAVTPSKYAYLIRDLFETIILHQSRIESHTLTVENNGKYKLDLEIVTKKFEYDEIGQETEVPIADWIDVTVYDKDGNILYMKEHYFTDTETSLSIILEKQPASAVIDPLYLQIDASPFDNTQPVDRR